MSIQVGIGFSRIINITEAAKEAALQAKENLKSDRTSLVIIFSTLDYTHQNNLPVINEILKSPRTIGCSTAGIITSEFVETRGIAVMALYSHLRVSDDSQSCIATPYSRPA